ncbi:hypothetical protein F5878DRAFT_670505 [Lentinula raphanica]|uniref:Uncharacterized protein n=1 Tax=Lentinula raphanica TaxID=153919 RepID=A0AA38PE89_9AGAR|nr:hypothetical protein F5878DRAFT_670505 [Lentinula raphanica]
MISPAAYNALKPFIPLPEIRTLQRQRAKLSKLPVDIQPRTFVLARAHLDALGYSGPVALSCDDTKLQPAFRPFYDEDRQSWCILGSTGVPAVVADPEEYCKMVHEAGIQKATKLRLWCMTPCCPGVSPYILAAKAIPNTLTVPVLFKYSDDLIRGLLAEGILVCSYACDGTVVERNIQHQLEQSAESTITHNIYDPRSKNPTIVIRIPVIAGQAMALIQDDLHLLKTIRNNVFSGAHLLVFPNCVVLYRQVREIALQKGPLYNRDVGSNSDKQDDNAALRFCSANTLEWLVSGEHYSDENIGLIVYIFVFGELIDAFQSQTISLAERARMVLRAYFFLDIWERFLDVAGYPKSKYFLSRDSIDIIRILIRGFFQIILIHRDHLPKQHPVFPHIIGTSICEHVFGISRKIDPDFTMYSWYILLPKIMLMLRNAVQLSEQGKDGKARARGYNHSYLDRHGIDVAALSAFPSDSELDDASRAAYDDAISLFSLLGLSPEELEGSSSLPSISSWFTPSSTEPPIHVRNSQMHEPSDDESCCGIDSGETSDESDDDTEPRLQSLVDAAESIEPDTNSENRELMRYRFAAVALEIDKDLAIGALPEEDEASQMENISNDIECIGELLAASLPVPNHDDAARPHFTPLDLMDLSKLSAIRKSHETRLAASATRTFCGITPEPDAGNKTGPELHIKLAFQKIINDEARKDHAEGSGVLRKLRWTTAKGSTEVDGEQVEESTGNAANAASAAKSRATAVSGTRFVHWL